MKEYIRYEQEGMKRTLEEWEDELLEEIPTLEIRLRLDRINMFKFNLKSGQGEFDKPLPLLPF